MSPEFTLSTGTCGLDVVDPIETRRFTLQTDAAVAPTPVETDGFTFPVASACRIHTAGFELQHTVPVDVRAADGTHLAEVSPPTRREFDAGEYLLDLHGPLKIYVWLETGFCVEATTETVRVTFGEETPIRIGARSYHSSPAATITVPDDPEAVMQAVSTFPSALKTTSPERSWPTLRGHPPRIERGETLDIPASLDTPETGVSIEIPPEYGAIYAVAPLAFYLGADLKPADTPRVVTTSGVEYALGGDSTDLDESVKRLLKRVFTLDCVTRTEGYHQVALHERAVLEARTDLDFAALYDVPLGERLAAYLTVPDDAVDAITPTWHRVTHVRANPETVEVLARVVDDLSLVQIERPTTTEWTDKQRAAGERVDSFYRRAGSDDAVVRAAGGQFDRRGGERDDDGIEISGIPDIDEHVPVADADAFEQVWAGEGTMLYATELVPDALARETPAPTAPGIDITVVCNDAEMREEIDAVTDIYGEREDLPITVEAREAVHTADLRALLHRDTDLFHFIGHIDGDGFECPDGVLDAETITETGATAVLLNGCRSYEQGRALVDAGASATVATLWDVLNLSAVDIGEMLARLLNHGFSVGTGATIIREYIAVARDYLVLGDPNVTITQCENGTPLLYHLHETRGSDDEVVVEPHAYPNLVKGAGTVVQTYLPDDEYHLAVGACGKTSVQRDHFRQLFAGESEPLVVDGDLVWSDDWLESD